MMLPILIDSIEEAPPGLAILALLLFLWTGLLGAGSIVWGMLP
jgi:hypothetical protein